MNDQVRIDTLARDIKSGFVPDDCPGLRHAPEICERLRRAIASDGPVEIDVGALTGLDVSFLQILVAVRKSAERRGRKLVLTGTLTQPCRDILVALGFLGPDARARTPAEAFWPTETPCQAQVA